MAVYSISDLEKLTGIKAATLRAWEQRYGIIKPRRTETNIRYYLDEDLRELLNIALLNKNGLRISKIARMREEERAERVAAISSIQVTPDTQLDTLTLSTVELNEFKFSHIVDTNIRQRGFEETMLEVIYPFLDKIGVLYFTGSITAVQEAFISNLIRRKLIAAVDDLPNPEPDQGPVFCLYLPEGDVLVNVDNFGILRCNGLDLIADTDGVSEMGAADGSATIIPGAGFGPYTYDWSNGATTATVDNLAFGDYDVIVTDAFGCAEEIAFTIDLASGADEATALLEGVQVFPNPTDGVLELRLDLPQSTALNAALYDMTGRELLRRNFGRQPQLTESFDLSSLPAGIYLLRIQADNAAKTVRVVRK